MKKLLPVLALVLIGASFASYHYAKADIYGSNLVLWYTLDSNNISGTSVTDLSGNSNTGTLTGSPVVGAGQIGQALTFTSTANYIDVPASASLNSAGGAITMCAWVYFKGNTAFGFQGIMAKRNGSGYDYGINLSPAVGAFQVYTSGASGVQNFSTYTLAVNKWTHICGVISAAPTALYSNGTLFGTLGSGGGIDHIGANLHLANSDDGHAEFFNGTEDDIRIYNTALSAAQIRAIYYWGVSQHMNGGF